MKGNGDRERRWEGKWQKKGKLGAFALIKVKMDQIEPTMDQKRLKIQLFYQHHLFLWNIRFRRNEWSRPWRKPHNFCYPEQWWWSRKRMDADTQNLRITEEYKSYFLYYHDRVARWIDNSNDEEDFVEKSWWWENLQIWRLEAKTRETKRVINKSTKTIGLGSRANARSPCRSYQNPFWMVLKRLFWPRWSHNHIY